MKLLCLHGAGTNASVLESQLMPLYNSLSKEASVEFHFLEGEHPSAPAADISSFYQGPYYSFYPWPPLMDEAAYRATLEDAYELIYEAIEEEGPFDGVLGFSQGASLAYSFLQQHARKNPFDPPWAIFRYAVFICGMPPFTAQPAASQAQSYGDLSQGHSLHVQEVSERLLSIASASPPRSESSCSGTGSTLSHGPVFSTDTSPTGTATPLSVASVSQSSTPNLVFQGYNIKIDKLFGALRIPSLHIGGKEDEVFSLTKQLFSGMEKSSALWVEHTSGHTIPWDKKSTEMFASAIRELEKKAILF